MGNGKPMPAKRACAEICAIIEEVDNRCLVADGPVLPTRREITDAEMKRIYRLAMRGAAHAE